MLSNSSSSRNVALKSLKLDINPSNTLPNGTQNITLKNVLDSFFKGHFGLLTWQQLYILYPIDWAQKWYGALHGHDQIYNMSQG